jgi:RHS repeat-associated protein
LKKATGGTTPSWTQTYVYDRYGNRTGVTASGTADDGSPIPRDGLASVAYSTTTNRITTAGFAYDAAGNQVRALIPGSTASQRFQYDAANRPVKVKADDNVTVLATYTYGDSNERLITDESGYRTYYVSEGGTVIAEYSETPSLPTTPKWSKSYVYLGGRLLSTLTPNGSGGETVNYHHPDRLGTRLVTDPVAGTSFEQVTLPFGTALSAESTGATNRRFTSYDRGATSGLDYAVNRHYDSQQGRFTQVDPAGMNATSLATPQTLNLYAYCNNDPINNTDPSGLGFFSFLKKALKWIGIAISVALIVIGTAGLMLAASLPAFLPLIGSTVGLASYITATSIGLLVTGALGLVSQVVPGKVGFIAGLALIGWNVFSFVKSLSKGGGFGFQDGGYNPGDVPGLTGPCPNGDCIVNVFANYSAWEMAAWWAQQGASSGIAVARSLGNFAASQTSAIVNNELKVIRCSENNRFSAAVSYLTRGSRFHGVATFAAESAEILPTLSVASDVPATIGKAGRTGIGGTTEPYASGINWAVRRMATGAARGALTTVGGAATRTFAVTFAFTTGYNAVQGWACRFGLQR